jgi:3-isopropylmalate dehydrogenase
VSGQPPRVTLVHKTNILTFAGDLWNRTFETMGAKDFPSIERDYLHVDAACLKMVMDPGHFDVIVTENLFGDIITDLAAGIQGGLGMAPSANLDPTRRSPSMFEPVHGSAPDIAGKGIANPVAAILSLAHMLRFLDEPGAAQRVDEAVVTFLRDSDPALATRTSEIGDRIAVLAGE